MDSGVGLELCTQEIKGMAGCAKCRLWPREERLNTLKAVISKARGGNNSVGANK